MDRSVNARQIVCYLATTPQTTIPSFFHISLAKVGWTHKTSGGIWRSGMIMRISSEVLCIRNNYTMSESLIQMLSMSSLRLLLCSLSIDMMTGRDAALNVDNSLIDAADPLSRELRLTRRVLQYSEQRGKSNKTYTAVFGKPRY